MKEHSQLCFQEVVNSCFWAKAPQLIRGNVSSVPIKEYLIKMIIIFLKGQLGLGMS